MLVMLALGGSHLVFSQVVGTMPTRASESFYLYEVKLIDEFIERFNDDPSSYIRQQCISLYGTDSIINRRGMLRSLIDKARPWSADLDAFISEITKTGSPQFLSFTDSSWYAVATCVFLYNKKPVEIPLVLHIKTTDGGSRWMIAGIGNSPTPGGTTTQATTTQANPPGDFIPTSSHGTDFVVFNNVFSSRMNPTDYFEPALLATTRAQQFIQLIKERKATFQRVKKIKYHFYTIDGRVFIVEQFKRKGTNTGWLISNLQKADEKQKAAMLKGLLYP